MTKALTKNDPRFDNLLVFEQKPKINFWLNFLTCLADGNFWNSSQIFGFLCFILHQCVLSVLTKKNNENLFYSALCCVLFCLHSTFLGMFEKLLEVYRRSENNFKCSREYCSIRMRILDIFKTPFLKTN
jgi:hypothetical protein